MNLFSKFRRDSPKPSNSEAVEEGGSIQVNYVGIMSRVILVICVIWTVFQLYTSSYGVMAAIKFRSWHLGF